MMKTTEFYFDAEATHDEMRKLASKFEWRPGDTVYRHVCLNPYERVMRIIANDYSTIPAEFAFLISVTHNV